jgi:hypothetical protein
MYNLWLKFDCIALKFDISASHSYSAGDESRPEITKNYGSESRVSTFPPCVGVIYLRNEANFDVLYKRIIKKRKLSQVTINRIQYVKINFITYNLIYKIMFNII